MFLVLNSIRDVEKEVPYLCQIYTPGERVSQTSQIVSNTEKIKSMLLGAVQHYKMYRK